MSTVYILIPLAILILGGFLGVFIVAVRRGQFDDLDTPPMRMICDGEDDDIRAGVSHGPGGVNGQTPPVVKSTSNS